MRWGGVISMRWGGGVISMRLHKNEGLSMHAVFKQPVLDREL